MRKRAQSPITASRASTNARWAMPTVMPAAVPRSILLLVFLSGAAMMISARAEAQLPDAPVAGVIAPLKRFSFAIGVDNKYSLTTSLYTLTPRLGISVRAGEHETVGFSCSHSTVLNNKHVTNNSVEVWASFRVLSWGKIPGRR